MSVALLTKNDISLTSKRALRTIYYQLPISTWVAKAAFQKFSPPYKLNIGCGTAPQTGWINIDYSFSARANIRWDLRKSFPLEAESCTHIYQESLFEVFVPDEGRALLCECYRLLASEGVMRIAMPALEEVVDLYLSGEWRHFNWREPGYEHYELIKSGAQFINSAFRHPGNRWLYDWDDLNRVIGGSGFAKISRAEWGQSVHPEFRNLETRPESNLICEVYK